MMIQRTTVGSGKDRHPRYYLREGVDNVAYFDSLLTAGLVSRFLKGAHLYKEDYDIAKMAIEHWDEAHPVPDPDDTI